MLIAQISDPHVRPRGVLYQDAVDANACLAQAVHHLNTLSPQPDVVLLTGDVVDEGRPEEYAAALEILAGLAAPLLVLPGNHDERGAFRAAFREHAYLPAEGPLHYAIQMGPLRILALDITVPGQHHGDFDAVAEAWLTQALAEQPATSTIVMMHQPPIVTDVPYLDEYRCFGEDRLAAVVARFPSVERLLCGHVHRMICKRFGGTMLCTAPSTVSTIALRIAPDAEPASFLDPPGFLLHHWQAEAGLTTHYVPIGTFPGPFPFA